MKNKSMKILTIVALVMVLLLSTISVKAVTLPPLTENNQANTQTNTDGNAQTTNTVPAPAPVTPSVQNNTTTNTNRASNYSNTNNLPQTGDASDYLIFALIIVALVSAIYAYKRVKDYKNM